MVRLPGHEVRRISRRPGSLRGCAHSPPPRDSGSAVVSVAARPGAAGAAVRVQPARRRECSPRASPRRCWGSTARPAPRPPRPPGPPAPPVPDRARPTSGLFRQRTAPHARSFHLAGRERNDAGVVPVRAPLHLGLPPAPAAAQRGGLLALTLLVCLCLLDGEDQQLREAGSGRPAG